MEVRFKYRTAIYILSSIVVLSALTITCNIFGISVWFDHLIDINYFELLSGQIANTLIVLSLTSVLSSDFGQAYWVDIKESKLVTPFWGCFIGITVYLLTALVFSVCAYAAGIHSGIVVSAVFATVLLIVLTFKMISIYFGKEELKKQLSVEYKHKMILYHNSYVSDYLRKLQEYLKEVEEKEFSGKGRYISKLKKEIQSIETGLNSDDERIADASRKNHLEKYFKCLEDVKTIDLKIIEYTKNAISNNVTEVVKENIGLLTECQNYYTFLNLLEELFDWDEKYACVTLSELSKKNRAWIVKEKMNFFKKYALNKLITQSGKLDAIQNLLLIYDPSNLGMSKLEPQINDILDRQHELREKEDEQLSNELLSILQNASTKDFRMYYLPIRETCTAYDEGKYEIVNKYLTVILENYHQELRYIRIRSGITNIGRPMEFTFSYVTEEEKLMIDQLIEKDRNNHYISEMDKTVLSNMDTVSINNDTFIV